MFFCTISPFFLNERKSGNLIVMVTKRVVMFPKKNWHELSYHLLQQLWDWDHGFPLTAWGWNKELSCLWKNNVYLSTFFIFIMQLGKFLVLQSMNCKASTSPIFLLFFQTSHSLQWLQSIANSKIFPVFQQ